MWIAELPLGHSEVGLSAGSAGVYPASRGLPLTGSVFVFIDAFEELFFLLVPSATHALGDDPVLGRIDGNAPRHRAPLSCYSGSTMISRSDAAPDEPLLPASELVLS